MGGTRSPRPRRNRRRDRQQLRELTEQTAALARLTHAGILRAAEIAADRDAGQRFGVAR